MTSDDSAQKSLAQRLKAEMREYLIISLYLWLCFTTILFYEGAMLDKVGVEAIPLSIAAIKALVFGKFILLGKAVGLGEKVQHSVLIHRIVWKSLAFLVLLVLFTGVEELVVGWLHDLSFSDIVAEVVAVPAMHKLAASLLILMVLIPMITFEEVDRALGEGELSRMLFSREGGQ